MGPVSSSTNSENQQTLFSKVSQKVYSNLNRVMVPLNTVIDELKNVFNLDDDVPGQSSKWTSSMPSELMIGGILSTLMASYIALRYFRSQESAQVNRPIIDNNETDWKMIGTISLPIMGCLALMGILVLKLNSTREKEYSYSTPLKKHQVYGYLSPLKYLQDWLTPTKKESKRPSSPIHNDQKTRDPSPIRKSTSSSPNAKRCLFHETPEANVNLTNSGLGLRRDFDGDSFGPKSENKLTQETVIEDDDEINPLTGSTLTRSALDFELDIVNSRNHDKSSYPLLMQGSGTFIGS